ncbi:MAG TPA: response regulator transcription factor [Candidatus Binatia bacterium]|nr:response regulator transcription factor [Candidatus Binatia bacterium]
MHRASILLIEDDSALLRGLKDNFEAQDYDVRLARDGDTGLRTALADPPDLLILDIMLPRMNGFEICRGLRAKGLEMPIIMLTAKGQEQDIIRGLELGADDYVTKPFSIRELLARVKAFLRRRESGVSSVLAFGECKLHLTAHKLFRNDKEVELTAKEFRLLEFFARRPGRALTRDQILDAVWGNDIIVNHRSVDRCITTLRAKIEAEPHHPEHIVTIRDVGYRFEGLKI